MPRRRLLDERALLDELEQLQLAIRTTRVTAGAPRPISTTQLRAFETRAASRRQTSRSAAHSPCPAAARTGRLRRASRRRSSCPSRIPRRRWRCRRRPVAAGERALATARSWMDARGRGSRRVTALGSRQESDGVPHAGATAIGGPAGSSRPPRRRPRRRSRSAGRSTCAAHRPDHAAPGVAAGVGGRPDRDRARGRRR